MGGLVKWTLPNWFGRSIAILNGQYFDDQYIVQILS